MKILFSVLKYLFIALVVSTVAGSAIVAGVMVYFSRGLPDIITVEDYHPSIVTQVLGKNNAIIGEFFEEKRYVLPQDKIPEMVSRAFVSAEDDRFFEHQGIDLQGIVRAAIANFRAGRVVQGGSTITQQVAKSLLLTPERSFFRKIREVILASRMEKNLSKKQILYLYLNQIYLGQGAYGIEAASEIYFNKEAKDLSVAEAAILAGLPQAPSKYSPLINPKKAKERQGYVLRRMNEDGVITKAQMEQAMVENVRLHLTKDTNLKYAPYYVEYIRKHLIEKYGKEKLYQGGLVIKSPVDPQLSLVAMKSMQDGLRIVDKKQGYRGPIRKNKKPEDVEKAIQEAIEYNVLKTYPFKILQTDGTHTTEMKYLSQRGKSEKDIFQLGEMYQAVVERVDDAKKEAIVRVSESVKASIPFSKLSWAQRVKEPSSNGVDFIQRPSQAVEKGDLIWVSLADKTPEPMVMALEQVPMVQGALLSLDSSTGDVLAMVGGYDFELSEFNRSIQALRQPGSAFKPIIYSAAVDKGYTPATIIQDSPIVLNAGENLKWKPENYEEKFYGDTLFRSALIKSRNVPTIKIVQDIELPYALDYAKRVGFSENLPNDYSIALGSASISVLDLVRIYAIYPRGGRKIKPLFIHQILDRDGKVLEENIPTPNPPPLNLSLGAPPKPIHVCGELQAEKKNSTGEEIKRGEFVNDPADPDRVLDPRTSFVMTHLMNEVATIGTGAEAKNLGRPAAGKTGTTNDNIDAWFMGFIPQMVTGVWVGFDTQKTIAPKATGALIALPIWVNYMKEAVKGYPVVDFAAPKGISFVSIDAKTGKKVSAKAPGAVLEAFVEGTEPGATSYSNTSSAGQSRSGSPNGEGDEGKKSAEPESNEDFFKQDIGN